MISLRSEMSSSTHFAQGRTDAVSTKKPVYSPKQVLSRTVVSIRGLYKRVRTMLVQPCVSPASALNNGRTGLYGIGLIQNSFNQVLMKPIYIRSSCVSRPHVDRIMPRVDTGLDVVRS